MYLYVSVGALHVCVCGLLKLRTLRFCLLNNYFSLICAIFFTGIHNPQLRLHWTIADDGGGEIGFRFGFARLKHSLHFLIHFTRATTRIFMQLWTTREWKTNRKMLKSVLKRGRCACMLLSLHLFVGYARVCHKKTVRAAQANNHVRSQRVFLAFWESMHMCVFVSVGCVVSFAGALSRTQPNATARIHRQYARSYWERKREFTPRAKTFRVLCITCGSLSLRNAIFQLTWSWVRAIFSSREVNCAQTLIGNLNLAWTT